MKRTIAITTTLAVAMGLITTLQPAAAAPKPKVVIEDPLGDANFINDQGSGDGSVGDVVGPADVSMVTDLIKVSFSNDSKNLYITIETETPPPATQGVGYRVRVNREGPGNTHCLHFEAFFPGAGNNLTEAQAHLRDTCGGGAATPVKIIGSIITVPRKAHEAFGKGATLTAPQAQGFIYVGTYPAGVPAPTVDTTKIGTDYKFVR